MHKALEVGINFFGTANVYSLGASEAVLGTGPPDFVRREEDVIVTKVQGRMRAGPNGGGSRAGRSWARSARASGGWAQTIWTWTRFNGGTRSTPTEETMEALHDVVRSGKARYIGAFALWAWQLQRALHGAETHGWTRFALVQNRLDLSHRGEVREMLPLCRLEKIGVISYGLPASGRLTRSGSPKRTLLAETDQIATRRYGANRPAGD
ncbi:aldo/keto reductase [Deinococcus hopiensis]|uniref:aldo/keto reductase n=1 Tax=Deinococcus hopiensis TaxID=309885 RepID=UPI00111C4674|nr:aldo/keto reductase [Deinococcus hopiensis]